MKPTRLPLLAASALEQFRRSASRPRLAAAANGDGHSKLKTPDAVENHRDRLGRRRTEILPLLGERAGVRGNFADPRPLKLTRFPDAGSEALKLCGAFAFGRVASPGSLALRSLWTFLR